MTRTQAVTPLRQRMLDDMRLRNMAAGTCRSYVRSVADFSAFHGRSPDELTLEDVRDYQLHLVARGLKAASICPIMSALRFLYAVTLDRPEDAARIPLPRKADPLPAILSPDEVARLLGAVADLWMRALLTTVYAAGLRVSEAVALQVTDIDSARMTIRVREGKGGRDRYVMLSPQLLAILRAHWRRVRPRPWLFPGPDPSRPITTRTVRRACRLAVEAAGLDKSATVHTIRTQSIIRFREALTPRRGAAQGDDMADLQAAIADDDALDHELQDRLLVGQRRLVQAAADAGAERRQVHPRRFGSQPLLA